jgi:peptide/nickel transport system substrate-binding protein
MGEFSRMLTSETLTMLGIDGRAMPSLAERWSWESENLRLRVKLRTDVRRADGQVMTADLTAELMPALLEDEENLGQYPALNDIQRVWSDGTDLIFDLRRPSAFLPEDLALPLGVGGPYRDVTTKDEDEKGQIALERFDGYYLGRPRVKRIEVTPYDALRTAWASLLRGGLDMVSDVPADAVGFVNNEAVQVKSYPRWYQFAIVFNSARPALRSPEVRRALNLAIDRAGLIEHALHGRGRPAHGPIWPRYWAYDSSVAPHGYDPAAASAQLDQIVGKVLSPGGNNSVPPARLRFTCLVMETFTVQKRIAMHVQRDLLKVGVDMQIRTVSREEYGMLIGSGQFDAAMGDINSGPTPGRIYMFWASRTEVQSPYNVMGFENPEAERLFATLRSSFNEAAVRSTTARLQRVFMEDPPALFLAWNERARAISRTVQIPDEPDRDPMRTIARWSAAPSAAR